MRKFKVNVNGTDYNVEVEEIGGVETVSAPVAKTVAAAPAAAPAKKTVAGGNAVKAPMPGMILKFEVKDGDTVKRGQKILVLEAMKMENDIVSEFDGVISFNVAKGANVNTGDVLATIA